VFFRASSAIATQAHQAVAALVEDFSGRNLLPNTKDDSMTPTTSKKKQL